MNLYNLFRECIQSTYIHVENSGDFKTKRVGNILYIFLESSNGKDDWKNNLDFFPKSHQNIWKTAYSKIGFLKKNCCMPVSPYKEMSARWFAHRGFLRVWKSVEPYIEREISDKHIRKVIIVGYSHGAALAVFCHEYIWFHRPDLRCAIEGYGFGCPRVFWGIQTSKIKKRWNGFTVIRNIDDIVTHVPPMWLGFSHVGHMFCIGKKGKYSGIDAHRPEHILEELKNIP